MTEHYPYRWPTKLRKFGIEDPFLKILATKYEKEIPWQVQVRDTATLTRYVENVMLPKFLERVAFPQNDASKNHFYISSTDVSLDTALNAEPNRDNSEIKTIENIRLVHGDVIASEALVKLINERKYLAFKAWIDELEKEYPNEHVFWLLLLRPLFELSGQGMRRTVIEPSLDVLEWLHLRINRGRLLPDESIANQYCLKLGLGSQKTNSDGWQFIPSGGQHAAQLSAASRGSGWCIADRSWASKYLESCEFYILRSNHQPVVALRVSAHNQIVQECQGRFNTRPEEWITEIVIFLKSQCLDISDYEMKKTSAFTNNFDSKSEAWWKKQISLWPFAVLLAPTNIKEELISEIRAGAFHYANFKNFNKLAQDVGLTLDQDFWRIFVEENPYGYVDCPLEIQALPRIQETCINSWVSSVDNDQMTSQLIRNVPEFVRMNAKFQETCIKRWVSSIDNGQMTAQLIRNVPEFVSKNTSYQEALRKNFPSSLRNTIRKQPSTCMERVNRFNMQVVLPAISGESAQLARERLVNVLLNNEDGIYSDDKFGDIERQREDFLIIREQAWTEAIYAHPPLWYALPVDLRDRKQFQPIDQAPSNVDPETWCLKVTQKPWLLTQQKGVPKEIRFHHRILDAYLEGWLPHLRKSPWRLWVSTNAPRRAYMSYALLADDRAITALAEGWLQAEEKIVKYWFSKPSARMQNIPAIQLSVLRAIRDPNLMTKLAGQYAITVKIRKDIEARQNQIVGQKLPNIPLHEEIRSLLA